MREQGRWVGMVRGGGRIEGAQVNGVDVVSRGV